MLSETWHVRVQHLGRDRCSAPCKRFIIYREIIVTCTIVHGFRFELFGYVCMRASVTRVGSFHDHRRMNATAAADAGWTLATNVVWGSSTLVALIVLCLMPRSTRRIIATAAQPRLCHIFSVYLAAHFLSTIPAIVSVSTELQLGVDPHKAALQVLTFALILISASTYVLLGTELLFPLSVGARRKSLQVVVPAYILITLTVSLLRTLTDGPAGIICLFAYYAAAVAWATCGAIDILRRHRRTHPVRCLVFFTAIAAGIIDFVLPAVAFLGLPIWRPDFIARALDSLLYLPGAVATFVWLDGMMHDHE